MADEETKKVKKKEKVVIPEQTIKKYARGEHSKVRRIKDKKLKGRLAKYESSHKKASLQAARSEFLLTEEPGYLEGEGLEKTFSFKQHDIANSVDIASAQKYFELKLNKFGPYRINYTRNGRFLLIGGKRGHVATMDWENKILGCEFHVQETVRDVRWLHIETMFAVAQKKNTYIYDNTGMELHRLKKHFEVNRMEFLPYHFLLATVGNSGFLNYLDVSTGKEIADIRTKLGRCDCMTQNPHNAIIHLGHHKGVVTLWSPSVKEPLVKMLCHRGPVQSIAIDRKGLYMATSGLDGRLKIWDVRMYKEMQSYYTSTPASCLSYSQRGLLAGGFGSYIKVFRDSILERKNYLYMSHHFPSTAVHSIQFCPYEDVLGVGHANGFSSLLIPGSGEPNFDALEDNPYQTKKQRQESEVKALLEKIQPELITLDPMEINKMDKASAAVLKKEREEEEEQDEKFEPKHKMKGRSSSRKRHLRKKGVEGERKKKRREEATQQQEKGQESKTEKNRPVMKTALDRFNSKSKS